VICSIDGFGRFESREFRQSRGQAIRAQGPSALTLGSPGMAIDTRTIAELEKLGFTHIDARCAGCGRIVQMPFRMLLERKQITTATTVAELRRRYRCQKLREFTLLVRRIQRRGPEIGERNASARLPWRIQGPWRPAARTDSGLGFRARPAYLRRHEKPV
jgi:hypothetical protein